MKIAYLIAHLGRTGVNGVVLDLVNQMQAHHHSCTVFFLEKDGEGIEYPCEIVRLREVQQLKGYDIVHAHGLKPEMFIFRYLWKRKGKEFAQTRFITTLHCYCFQDFFDLYGKVKGALMGCFYLLVKVAFDRVVCLSKDMMHYYEQWLPKRKLTYAYNTRDICLANLTLSEDEHNMINSFKGESTLIGMNCVLLYRKGIDVMLKALALLPQEYKLMIVGEGKEKDAFKQMAQTLGLKGRVLFAGSHPDAYRFLPYYDIYAMPSRSEGFPLVLLEAAAYGTKVVASSLPVVTECFSEHEVITFTMPDEKELAAAISKAIEDKDLGERLKERFDKDFSPETFYQNYMRIYQDA